ncbi:hypothetical protein L1077_20095 [Pseudoalteromonas luteoviolacea]|uniref:hypothetical protein n=1 Tax=Pseudoalteromonas luteoviolacea TaxID=43657 RepID=UPI001F237B22|nr:hypothetical protein [Pseudoalteromonas luteoviolacea]MCF6441742.1 hypothetical protein [Pseudoalteromonas luteoviolacea]
MDASYRIVFKGQTQPNINIDNAKSELCKLMGLSPQSCDKLFSGQAFALVKNLTKQEADIQLDKLQSIGLIVYLKGGDSAIQPENPSNNLNLGGFSNTVKKSLSSASDACKSATSVLKNKANKANSGSSRKPASGSTQSVSKKKKPNLWQRQYFKIVAYISFFWATVSIIAAILFTTGASVNIMDALIGPDVENQETTYHYLADYLKQQEEQKYAVDEEGGSYESAINASIEEQKLLAAEAKIIDDYFKQFEININAYAKELGQQSLKGSGQRKRLKSTFTKLDKNTQEHAFWKDIVAFTKDLSEDATSLEQLKDKNMRKVEWMDAVKWFVKRYTANLEAQKQAEKQQDQKLVSVFDAVGPQLIAIGVTFGMFMNFTMILALLRIERNTRIEA